MSFLKSEMFNRRVLWTVFFLGAFLRFYELGSNPLWIDEALFGFWVKEGTTQEFPTVLLARLLPSTEFGLRFFSALAGSLTIPAVYYSLKNRKYSIYAAVLVSVFPLFVFWPRMARPYAFAGLFIVLGWRYWWFYIVAIFTTPVALIGVRVWKQNKLVLLGFAAFAIGLFLMREDAGRERTLLNTLNSSRWYYAPCLVSILYFFDYLLPFLLGENNVERKRVVGARGWIQRLAG